MTAGRRKDLVLGASAAAIAAATTAVRFAADPGQDVGAASIAGSALIGAALGVGRWRPRAGWLLAVAGLLLGAVDGGVLLVPYALAMLQAFEAGRRETRSAGVCAVAAIVAASLVGAWVGHDSAAPFLFLAPAVWGAGRALRERELVAARLAERARELEEEREAYAQLSVRYERARIAAELHDIVAHAISVMVVQAGAGQRLVTVDPALTAEAFEAIADSARQAEQDMARLVALLSDDEAIGPAPDLALVEELVGRAAGSGLDVALRLEASARGFRPRPSRRPTGSF